jgi:predicted MFS family arabinose efflux permease
MGFIALAISLASFPALLSGSSGLKTPRKARKLVDMAAFQDRLFVIFTCASFACFLGYIIPYFYIPTYAQDHLGVSPSFALYILVIAIAGIILRAAHQRIYGALCWQHAYMDGMCARLGHFVFVLDRHQKVKGLSSPSVHCGVSLLSS